MVPFSLLVDGSSPNPLDSSETADVSYSHTVDCGKKATFLFISISPLKILKFADKFMLKVKFHSLGNPYLSYKLDQMMFGVPYYSLKVKKIILLEFQKV